MKNINENAIIVIYPNGKIEKRAINDNLLHISYFRELCDESPEFKTILEEHNINVFNIKGNIRNGFNNLNILLSELGIISFYNLRIKEIRRNKLYEKAKPYFLVTLPEELTDEQNLLLREMFNEYDFSKSHFGKYIAYKPKDIEYENIFESVNTKHK